MQLKRFLCIFYFIFTFAGVRIADAQYQNTSFGQNRVQYRQFKWKVLTSNNFYVYYYNDGNAIAYKTIRLAESEYKKITESLGYFPYSKQKIMIYNSPKDLAQSNVGLAEQNVAPDGQINFLSSTFELAYKGNQAEFEKTVSTSLAKSIMLEMLFGGNISEILQSNYLLSVPEWFIEGASAYLGEGWSIEMDDYMRDAVQHFKLKNPSKFHDYHAKMIGLSIWNFIIEKYGITAMANIFTITKYSRNEEFAIESVVNMPFESFIKEWKAYYLEINSNLNTYKLNNKKNQVRINNRNGYSYLNSCFSPSGDFLAYSENNLGHYKIYLKDTKTGYKKIINSGGYKNYNLHALSRIPLLAWRNNRELAVIGIKKDRFFMETFEVKADLKKPFLSKSFALIPKVTKRPDPLKFNSFNSIQSFSFSSDGSLAIFSAEQKGQSDIYLYETKRRGRFSQITNDKYDDSNPSFLKNSNQFIFSSNRPNDTLGKQSQLPKLDYFNIFIGEQNANVFKRISFTNTNSWCPKAIDDSTILFIDDKVGIKNITKLNLKTLNFQSFSNFQQSVNDFDYHSIKKLLAYNSRRRGQEILVFEKDFSSDSIFQELPITNRQNLLYLKNTDFNTETPVNTNLITKNDSLNQNTDTEFINIDNYVFDYGSKTIEKKSKKKAKAILSLEEEYKITGPNDKINMLRLNKLITSLTFDNLRGSGTLIETGGVDRFGNHNFKAGFLGIFDLNSGSIYGEYSLLKFRTDFKIRYEKNRYFAFYSNPNYAHIYDLNKLELTASYPLSNSMRFEITPSFANNSFEVVRSPSSIDDRSLPLTGLRTNWVFDNTFNYGPNLLKGTRMNVFWETYQKTGDFSNHFSRFNIDIRNYQPIHNELIWATRLSCGHSMGNSAPYVVLGGLDNFVNFGNRSPNSSDANSPLSPPGLKNDNKNIMFMHFATNLRGFNYGAMYGKSYFLLNNELRFPLVKYFYKGTVSSNFLRNLMVLGFFDIGSAWTGNFPVYIPIINEEAKRNTINTTYPLNGNPFTAEIVNYEAPYLYSYGFGIRSYILGFYAKLDIGWGVKDFVSQPVNYAISLGYDF